MSERTTNPRRGAAGRRARGSAAADVRSRTGQPGEPVESSTTGRRRSSGDALPALTPAGASAGAPAGQAATSETEAALARAEIRPAETVSVATAARLLGVSRRTLLYLLAEGRLQGWRLRPRGWWKVYRESLARLGG